MRYEMTDEHWARLEPLLPHSGRGGQWRDHRQVLNGILWVLHTGAPWRDLPERYGPWQTVFDRFNRWRQDGMWNRLCDALLAALAAQKRLEWEVACLDSTTIRASRSAGGGGGKKGASRKLPTMGSAVRAAGSRPSSTSRATAAATS